MNEASTLCCHLLGIHRELQLKWLPSPLRDRTAWPFEGVEDWLV